MKLFKNHRRLLSLVLSLVMCLGLVMPAFATTGAGGKATISVGGSTSFKIDTSPRHLRVYHKDCKSGATAANSNNVLDPTGFENFAVSSVNGVTAEVTGSLPASGYLNVTGTKPGVWTVTVTYDAMYEYGSLQYHCDQCDKNFTYETDPRHPHSEPYTITVNATYTLSYDANGGSGAPASETKTVAADSATFTVSGTPTREGYTFKGWSDGSKTYKAGDTVTLNWGSGANVEKTLTAVWEKDPEPTPHEHTWDKGTVTKEPSCTVEGVKTFTCTECKETRTESVAVLGHDFEGAEWKDNCGDSHTGANCTGHTMLCKRCLGHEDNGSKTGGHNMVAGEPVQVGNKITTTFTCSDCGHHYSTESDCKHEADNEAKKISDATCIAPAMYRKWCNDCEAYYGDAYAVGEALGHAIPDAWTDNCDSHEDADCDGHTQTCTRCKGTLEGGSKAEGHNFGEWNVKSLSGWFEVEDDPDHLYQTATVERVCADCRHAETDTVSYDDEDHKGVPDEDLRKDKDPEEPEEPAAESYALTINYVYADGREAAPTHTETVVSGAYYYVNSPVIRGYTANRVVVAGKMADGDVTVTVVYTANVVDPGTPIVPVAPVTPAAPETEIVDPEVPMAEEPEEEEIAEPEVPMAEEPAEEDIADPDVPMAEEPAAEEEIADTDVPMADVPKTGDLSVLWYAASAFSALGLTVLNRKKEENDD